MTQDNHTRVWPREQNSGMNKTVRIGAWVPDSIHPKKTQPWVYSNHPWITKRGCFNKSTENHNDKLLPVSRKRHLHHSRLPIKISDERWQQKKLLWETAVTIPCHPSYPSMKHTFTTPLSSKKLKSLKHKLWSFKRTHCLRDNDFIGGALNILYALVCRKTYYWYWMCWYGGCREKTRQDTTRLD